MSSLIDEPNALSPQQTEGSDRVRMEEATLKKFHDMKCLMADEMEPGKGCTGSGKAHKVGIIADFWEENTFGWLHQALSSYHFSEIIKRILFINTSDKDIKKVFKMMSSCSFYVYICSGYNRETFPAMRQRLGLLSERRNLIIIIHNLEDSSERKKETILQENGNRVPYHNVFLFSKMDLAWNYLNRLVNDHQPGSARRKKNKG
ncbi:uncharacterized protein ACNLHF_025016 [Anomaloglossus baeobatrachus]|uniref:uncharacterized protein LOC142246834 n=1 Tax=Anomaloglossus baeobatrachus TaxID=238106 RepID=UPI003F504C14